MRKTLTVVVCSLSLIGLTAGGAAAGEITGNGELKEVHGKSICAYSGLNDEPDAPAPEGGRVQSYGQLVKGGFIAPQQFNPGDACNPNLEPPEPPEG